MASRPDEVFYSNLLREIRRGRVTPFLGAGVNLCGRPPGELFSMGKWLPSGTELAHYLAREFNYRPARENDDADLLRVSQWVTVALGSGPLASELHDIFDRDYRPTRVHEVLAQLPDHVRTSGGVEYPLVLTTNYDDGLEQAFDAAGEEYDVLIYVAEGPDQGKFRHIAPNAESVLVEIPNKYDEISLAVRPVIAKIHGAVSRNAPDEKMDSYVISEDNYIDYLTRTDIAELLPAGIASRMMRCHYLFLGYSLRDWNLRAILHRIHREQALRQNSWVVQHHPDPLEEKAWQRRNVETFDVDLVDFMEELGDLLRRQAITDSSEGVVAS
jgi:hypothetical protein